MVLGRGRNLSISVNGDPGYNARTTRRAVGQLAADEGLDFESLAIDQDVETPIGSGFGASAASATSAVFAVASAAGIGVPRRKLALYAHAAEVAEQTGLGTVSVIYNSVGAGATVTPGEPGRAKFVTVDVPKGMRIVTASLAPYDKKDALSSPAVSRRINALGADALRAFLADPSLDSLAEQGEKFSARLGLETPEVKKLIRIAKSSGASHASQNMIGYAVHIIANEDEFKKVARALSNTSSRLRVDVFQVGRQKARASKSSRRRPGLS